MENNFTYTGEITSWMIFKQSNLLYAVDEISNGTRLFTFGTRNSPLFKELGGCNGFGGVIHLALNKHRTYLIGFSYGEGSVKAWGADCCRFRSFLRHNTRLLDDSCILLRRIPCSRQRES